MCCATRCLTIACAMVRQTDPFDATDTDPPPVHSQAGNSVRHRFCAYVAFWLNSGTLNEHIPICKRLHQSKSGRQEQLMTLDFLPPESTLACGWLVLPG
jgi:hypothetical protein